MPVLERGQPCEHAGCLSHIIHPCEGCNRVAGVPLHEINPHTLEPGSPLRILVAKALMAAHAAAFDEWSKKPRDEKYAPKPSMWELSLPTYLENWPKALRDLSIPSMYLKLSRGQAETLGSYNAELGEAFSAPENHETIKDLMIDHLDHMIRHYDKAFIRLGSRSPKDAMYWGIDARGQVPNGQITSGKQAFELLTAGTERIYEDLQTQLAMKYAPHIFVRKGIAMPDWCEFRCFMKDRELVGISQYNYRATHPEVSKYAAQIRQAITRFFDLEFRDACHVDSVVFDVFLEREERDPVNPCTIDPWISDSGGVYYRLKTRLLEINPYANYLTDPCLFKWSEIEQGSAATCEFRYQRETAKEG